MKSRNLKQLLWLLAGLLAVLLLSYSGAVSSLKATTRAATVEKHPDVDFTVSCIECHQEATPEVTTAWQKSMHGQVNVKCFVCHGDGQEAFSPKPTDARCISCHSTKEVDFSKVEASSCFSCHNGHTLKFHF